MLAIITTVEKRKLTQQAALEARFQYRPNRKGARKAPASAPQLTPMSWAMKVTLEWYCTRAMTTEMAMNTTIRQRMMNTWRFSLMSLMMLSFKKSRVRVELEASTREDRVDIEADSTRITTTAMSRSGRPESMVGMMES